MACTPPFSSAGPFFRQAPGGRVVQLGRNRGSSVGPRPSAIEELQSTAAEVQAFVSARPGQMPPEVVLQTSIFVEYTRGNACDNAPAAYADLERLADTFSAPEAFLAVLNRAGQALARACPPGKH